MANRRLLVRPGEAKTRNVGIEIERKFLVREGAFDKPAEGQRLIQGYLAGASLTLPLPGVRGASSSGPAAPGPTVRIRLADDAAWLTIKGATIGVTRKEFEYPIPTDDARQLLALCLGTPVAKVRYRVRHGDHLWEVDEFLEHNAGLWLAEIELSSEDESFDQPAWLGSEVSADHRYSNSALARCPYSSWGS